MRMLAILFTLLCVAFLLGYGGTQHTDERTVRVKTRTENMIMKFSDKGVGILKDLEGFKPKPYFCSAGKKTIGYGHKIKEGETFTEITEDEAGLVLKQDVAPIEKFINVHVSALVTQNQFDALVMFIYNIGSTAFLNSQVFQNLKNKMYDEATDPWSKWINVSKCVKCDETGKMIKKLIPVEGLINRRKIEIQLFNA